MQYSARKGVATLEIPQNFPSDERDGLISIDQKQCNNNKIQYMIMSMTNDLWKQYQKSEKLWLLQ